MPKGDPALMLGFPSGCRMPTSHTIFPWNMVSLETPAHPGTFTQLLLLLAKPKPHSGIWSSCPSLQEVFLSQPGPFPVPAPHPSRVPQGSPSTPQGRCLVAGVPMGTGSPVFLPSFLLMSPQVTLVPMPLCPCMCCLTCGVWAPWGKSQGWGRAMGHGHRAPPGAQGGLMSLGVVTQHCSAPMLGTAPITCPAIRALCPVPSCVP